MRPSTLRLLVAVTLTALLACGSDGNESPDAGATDAGVDAESGPNPLEPICNTSDGLFVDLFLRAFECNPVFEVFLGAVSASELSSFCFASIQPFVDDGTVTVDESALAACRTLIDETSCVEFDLDVAGCDDILIGALSSGDDCDANEQCSGGLYCEDSAVGCGECANEFANGAVCDEDEQCASSYCGENGTCVEKQRVGGACTGDDDCLGQLACDIEGGGLCVELPAFAVDDACDSEDFEACGFPLSGLFCGGTTNLCVAEAAVGGSCDNIDTRCSTINLEWCEDGTCAVAQSSAEGEACGIGFDTPARECSGDLRCSNLFESGICVSPQKEGEACVDTEGEDIDNECAFLLTCVDGTCQQTEHTGECPAP